jgi:trigger factor
MLNVQTDHLENHTARLTVAVEAERLERAMRQAARRLSQRGNIPGFRPGKAPYQIIVSLFGRAYVLEQALDIIGNDIYREALEASGVEPYAPGSLEGISEDGLKMTFVVPKRPTVTLGDYRAVRVEAAAPEVTDKMVNDTMESIREGEAVIEPASRPARLGDALIMEHFQLSVLFEEGEEEDDEGDEDLEAGEEDSADFDDVQEDDGDFADDAVDDEDDEDEDDEDDYDYDERVLLHHHDFEVILYGDERDLVPGLAGRLAGLSAGDEVEFVLDVPAGHEDETIAGQQVRVEAHVAAVQSRTLPEWSDALARSVSDGEFETILELRQDVRKSLAEQLDREFRQKVAAQALLKIVEQATFSCPEEMIQDIISDLIAELEDSVLSHYKLTTKDYLQISGLTEDELREKHRELATRRGQQTLAFAEFLRLENVTTSEAEIDAEIERMSARFGEEQAPSFRQYLSSAQGRVNIGNELVTSRGIDLLAALALGEEVPAPGLAPVAESVAAEEAVSQLAEAASPADSDAAADTKTAGER